MEGLHGHLISNMLICYQHVHYLMWRTSQHPRGNRQESTLRHRQSQNLSASNQQHVSRLKRQKSFVLAREDSRDSEVFPPLKVVTTSSS
jgi:K+-transporting ATPase c subunit